MTQILTCITEEDVVLVGDRRLVNLATGDVVDDEACKVVALGSQVALGFTGLANVRPPPRGRTDLWLAGALSPPPNRLPAVITKVAQDATSTFAKITHLGPRAKRHAFVAAGWQERQGGLLHPFITSISNALDENGRWLDMARPEFLVRARTLGEGQVFRLEVTGQPLERLEKQRLIEMLTDPINRTPRRLGSLLATAVRASAEKNSAVGSALLGIMLPCATAFSDGGFVLQPHTPPGENAEVVLPDLAGPAAFYVPSRSNAGVVYAPHHITPAMSVADLQIHNRALSPEEIKQDYEETLKKFQ